MSGFNAEAIKQDFPILDQIVNDEPLVYLDNAATTQKPTRVLAAIENYYLRDNANVHRGVHTLAERATTAYEAARERVRSFINAASSREVLFTRGTTTSLNWVARFAAERLQPGDEVLIPQPSYVSYEPCALLTGAKPVIINLKHENQFRLTAQELEEAITEKTKLLVLPFPNNPTGAIMERKDLEEIAEVIKKHDIFVISDEIYSELCYTDQHVSIANIEGMQERTILINGFSKSYAMTGWRLGYACGPKEIIEQMTKIHQFCIMCAPTTSQYAAVEALKNGDEDVQNMREAYNQRRRYLVHAFKEMGLECFEPFGAFYMFPCIKEFGMTSDEFATRFLMEEKVAVVPGTAFGDCGEGFIRISYAYSLDNLKLAIGRLQHFVEKLRAEQNK